MPLRNQHPYEWPPTGLSDAEDSTHAFRGAMTALRDMIPSPNTAAMWVCRPAAQQISNAPNKATCLFEVGNILYGMRHSVTFSGKDEPFAFNLLTSTYLTISGMTSGNLPTAQPDTGDWTPPTAAQIGPRVVFTHPGFPGGTTNAPYYQTSFANTYNTQSFIDGLPAGIVQFVQAGMSVYGAGIQAGTTVTAVTAGVVQTTCSGTSGTPTITVASAAGIVEGQTVTVPGVPFNSIVETVVGTTVTLSQNLVSNIPGGTTVYFSGNVVDLSLPATASANQVQVYFSSNVAQKIGWLDMTNFNQAILGNTDGVTAALTGGFSVSGIQPGMSISGNGIPANDVIEEVQQVTFVVPNVTVTSGSAFVQAAAAPTQGAVVFGMSVAGAGIPVGTTVINSAAGSPTNWEISLNATASGVVALTFSGSLLILSKPGTVQQVGASFTISGGTQTAPLWNAGDININPLAGVPVFVEQYAGSACYGVNTTNPVTSGVQFSDPGIPTQSSNASQAITFADGVPVTAAAGLALDNQLGGVIQSLMVFQGDANIRQITGSIALGNVGVNTLNTATGTLSPNSIAPTPLGLLFAASDGLRLIDFDARVSDPIGVRGEGIAKPFINVVTPTRTAAVFNENVYRISINWQSQSGGTFGAARRDEFWFHLDLKKWSGPHSFTSDLLAPWQAKNSFVVSDDSGLWQSDSVQNPASIFIERGKQMTWTSTTALLPDNPEQMATAVNESSIFFSMPPNDQALATATDDEGNIIGQAYVWVGPTATITQAPINWDNTAVFRQMSVSLTGNSSAQVRIGTLNLRYQRLGYQLPRAPVNPFEPGNSILGGPDVLAPGP